MLITTNTLPIVLGMIKKISKDYPILNTQLEYPAYKRNNNRLKKIGDKPIHFEQSNIHSFEIKEAEIHKLD